MNNLDVQCVNTLRVFSVNEIDVAKSGHPGIALGSAPILYALYANSANFYAEKDYFNRDRIVLSAGHASSLLYSIFYCLNYGIEKEDLKTFRRLGSKTTGHPEIDLFGVETDGGPLGQGIGTAVGMAIASKHMQNEFNTPKFKIINNQIFAFAGDGCMMEGVSLEALSIAGCLGLNNLTVVYDFNQTTIDGKTDMVTCENIQAKFEAMNFSVSVVEDGNDLNAISRTLNATKKSKNKPSLVLVCTTLGYGSLLAGKSKVHGAPLSREDINQLEEKFNIKCNDFEMTSSVKNHFEEIREKQHNKYLEWKELVKTYSSEEPALFARLSDFLNNDFQLKVKDFKEIASFEREQLATREYSKLVLDIIKNKVPNLIGGCADVSSSTKAFFNDDGVMSAKNFSARNIAYGIREHGMGAISNGICLYGGLRAFCSTFFVFSDYMRPSIRMACLQNLPVTYVLTHDSIGAGEDGPTHQPVEHLNSFRIMPNMTVFRPCDLNETIASYMFSVNEKKPTIIALSRQKVMPVANSSVTKALKGAYIVKQEQNSKLDFAIVATGSEVQTAILVAEKFEEIGRSVRVVSMPSMEVFNAQTEAYKQSVLPKREKTVSIEAGNTALWERYANINYGINEFGKSGRAEELFDFFGLSAERISKDLLIRYKF